jgi:WS/DGAT/MGAT family acyltransferase
VTREVQRRREEQGHVVRRLSSMDVATLRMETPSIPMHSVGTTILDASSVPDGGLDFRRIVAAVESSLNEMTPFRQRLLEPPLLWGRPILVDDPDFRIENHVHRAAVPSPGSLRELAELVADIAGRPLERGRPLWEMWVVEGLEGGHFAVVSKMHHCLVDGVGSSSRMGSLLDREPAPAVAPRPEWHAPPLPTGFERLRQTFDTGLVGPVTLAGLVARTARSLWSLGRTQLELAREGDLPISSSLPRKRFTGAITSHRCVAFGSTSLADVKEIKDAFGVKVNDVVLAACTLSLRRYLANHDDLPEEPIACAVPVSLRSDEDQGFSNMVSSMFVTLPIHLEEPEAVVRAVHEGTRRAKRLFEASDPSLLLGWLGVLAPPLIGVAAGIYSGLDLAEHMPAAFGISNVPGPPMPLYMAGARVLATYPTGPLVSGAGLNITVLSNMGRMDIGVIACPEIVPDVWDIAEGFGQAVAELRVAAEKRSAEAPCRNGSGPTARPNASSSSPRTSRP